MTRCAHAFADVGIGHGHALGESFDFLASLVNGDAGLEARDAEHVAVVTVAEHPLRDAEEHGLVHIGNPQIEGHRWERAVK